MKKFTSSLAVLTSFIAFIGNANAQIEGDACGVGSSQIIFLHDQVQDSTAFLGFWETVCAAPNVRAIRYDRRGYGQSPATDEPYSDVSDLAAILQNLGADQVTLATSGIGAEIALEFTLQYPKIVNGLVLSNPASTDTLEQNRAALSTLSVPVLVLTGGAAAPDTIAQAQAVAGALPQSETIVMLAAGRYIELDRPAAFAGAVLRFVSKLTAQ